MIRLTTTSFSVVAAAKAGSTSGDRSVTVIRLHLRVILLV